MAVTLSIRSTEGGNGAAQTLTFDQPRIVVGRGAHADVRLPARSVSSTHCVLKAEGGDLSIVDEGSTNGTLVNGALLVRGRRKAVRDGDRITLPGFELSISIGTAVADSPDRTATVARKLLAEAIAGAEGAPPFVELVAGRATARRWTFDAPPARLVIGRGDGCDVSLDDPDCSRQHAELRRDEQGVVLRDLGSKNGVFVAGRKVSERRLRDGDELQIGRVVLAFRDPAEELLRAFESGTDEARPVEPVRASTVPPPSQELASNGDRATGRDHAAQGDAPTNSTTNSTTNPPTDAPALAGTDGVDAKSGAKPPRSGGSAGDKAASAPAVRRASLDWVVAALALVILGVSVTALVLVLRSR